MRDVLIREGACLVTGGRHAAHGASRKREDEMIPEKRPGKSERTIVNELRSVNALKSVVVPSGTGCFGREIYL